MTQQHFYGWRIAAQLLIKLTLCANRETWLSQEPHAIFRPRWVTSTLDPPPSFSFLGFRIVRISCRKSQDLFLGISKRFPGFLGSITKDRLRRQTVLLHQLRAMKWLQQWIKSEARSKIIIIINTQCLHGDRQRKINAKSLDCKNWVSLMQKAGQVTCLKCVCVRKINLCAFLIHGRLAGRQTHR